jgi:hypothetical protein
MLGFDRLIRFATDFNRRSFASSRGHLTEHEPFDTVAKKIDQLSMTFTTPGNQRCIRRAIGRIKAT